MCLDDLKEKNDIIFNNKEAQLHQLVDKVKFLSFWWLKPIILFLLLITTLGGSTPCCV